MHRLLSLCCLALHAAAQMTESPLQISLSHRMIEDIINSAKSQVLQVMDNIKISDFEVEAHDFEEKVLIKNLTLSSIQKDPAVSDNFKLDFTFDEQKNYITMVVKEYHKAPMKGTGLIQLQGGVKTDSFTLTTEIKKMEAVLDMGHYTPIGDKHRDYLIQMGIPTEGMKQLALHIVDYSIELESTKLSLETAGQLKKSLRYDNTLRDAVRQEVDQGIKAAVQRRVDILNNPNEVLETINLSSLSPETLDSQIEELFRKLEITLPDKLILPASLFLLTNSFASTI